MTMELSEQHLNQALSQLRQVPSFDGSTDQLNAFIKRIDYILHLYPTRDVRQHSILYGAIELQVTGDAQRISQRTAANTWQELRNALIEEYKVQTPFEELLRRLYNTNYQGNVRKFIEELENKSFVILNKLALENIPSNTTLYTNAMNNTIKDVITKKLPDRLFMMLARHDITSTQKLKQVAQREGLYENSVTEKPKNNNVQGNPNNNRRNMGNYQQNANPTTISSGYSNTNQSYHAQNKQHNKSEDNQKAHHEFPTEIKSR
uniref:Gag n=1 Tax=Drosophila virilis TaxID=7244 RepID=O76325_DROVI|nr:gag [Drosophila virilis]